MLCLLWVELGLAQCSKCCGATGLDTLRWNAALQGADLGQIKPIFDAGGTPNIVDERINFPANGWRAAPWYGLSPASEALAILCS